MKKALHTADNHHDIPKFFIKGRLYKDKNNPSRYVNDHQIGHLIKGT